MLKWLCFPSKEDFIFTLFVPHPERGRWGVRLLRSRNSKQWYAFVYPLFGLSKVRIRDAKGDMIEHIGLSFLKAQPCCASLDCEGICSLYQQRQAKCGVIERLLVGKMTCL